MTTRFECPKHGAMKPGQILHNGHTYTCSTCGQGLRANSEDTRDAEIVRLRAERDALASHVERLRYALTEIASLTPVVEDTLAQRQSWNRMRDVFTETPETSLARLKAQWQAEALEQLAADSFVFDADELRDRANELRRQAEATS